jgi:AcrR family transcriptional regulator
LETLRTPLVSRVKLKSNLSETPISPLDMIHRPPSNPSDSDLHRTSEVGETGHDDKSVVRDRILLAARDQYLRLGFSRVTMDETASVLGISKKTLYLHFASKEDLVREVCVHFQNDCDAGIRAIHQDASLSPVQKLRRQTEYTAELYRQMSPSLIHDLQRSQPEIWRDIEDHRKQCVETDFMALIREGRANGTFRQDIDEHLFLKVYLITVEGMLHPQVLSDSPFKPVEVYETISRILFEGFLTDKARMDYHDKT